MEFLDYLEENNIDYKEEDGKIVIPGDLDLGFTNITKLPNNLSVGGSLDLYKSQLTKLPEKLSVGGDLNLNHTKITKLPDNLSVGENLYLDVKKITNIVYHKDCKWQREPIFAVFVNGEIQIAAGWFLGSLKAFEAMVDEGIVKEYITAADANKCKQAARECISELEQMRSRKN